jgi:hypothetical protein
MVTQLAEVRRNNLEPAMQSPSDNEEARTHPG